MGRLSDDLRRMHLVPTGEESPVHQDGELWTDGSELVCDETGTVIDGNHYGRNGEGERPTHRYKYSNNVKLNGGYLSSYDWGYDEENEFKY